MADNVPITAGTGTTVSTEEVTTLNGNSVTAQHVQRVATAFRTADGVASDAATGAGAVGASVQRTTLASDDPAVTALGATNSSAAANPSAIAGLSGLIRGMWTALVAGIGAIGDSAWSGTGNGSQIALLKTIATQTLSTAAQAILPSLTAASNGLTASRVNSAASTNATSLKTSAGNIGDIDVFNNAAYAVFLKLYNKASSPTVGTDTPVWTIPIAAGSGFSRGFPRGRSFATGIAYAITKLQADSDTTAVAAGDLTGSIGWI